MKTALLALIVIGCGGPPEPTSALRAGLTQSPSAERQRMQAYVDSRYDRTDVAHSFVTEFGDPVDCVLAHRQPGRRGSTEQPATPPETILPPHRGLAHQGFGAESCPSDTVPIRRVTLADIERFPTLEAFLGGKPQPPAVYYPPSTPAWISHDYSILDTDTANFGLRARFSIWHPYVQRSDEFSLSQLWSFGGTGGGLQTIESGLIVYQQKFGDTNTHWFLFSTPNNYQTNCWGLECGMFIQTNNSMCVGCSVGPWSVAGGPQYYWDLVIQKDGNAGHWWIGFGGQWIGYYRRTLYTSIANGASNGEVGGEIVNLGWNSPARYTQTDMGSAWMGNASNPYGNVAWISDLQYLETNYFQWHWITDANISTLSTKPSCYAHTFAPWDVSLQSPTLYYGGAGYNSSSCFYRGY